jgi:dipeptidyl aminopeptidase/acylaminoacyl peptidase
VLNNASRFTVEDLYRLVWLEDPQVRPDGREVAFVRVTIDRPANANHRAIWIVSTSEGHPRRFTSGVNDTSPRWSPDGRWLAFVGRRGDQMPQLYVVRRDGGEARCLTSLPQGISHPAWSPDGRRIAFLSRLNAAERAREDSGEPEPAPPDEFTRKQVAKRRKYEEERRFDPRVVRRLPYRAGVDFFDDRYAQIYLIDVPEEDDDPAPKPRRITDADLDFGAPVWMPDGQALLTTATRNPEGDSQFFFFDVLRVPVMPEGRAEPQRLTAPGFTYWNPRPSPDGRLIACLRAPEGQPFSAGTLLAVMDASGGALRDLTAATDLSIEAFDWLPDGDGLLCLAAYRGAQPLWQVALDGSGCQRLDQMPDDRLIAECDVGADGTVAFVAGDAANPCELYVRDPVGVERRLTAFNAPLLEERIVAPYEELIYAAPDGQKVQGWVIHPSDFDPARPGGYPLAVYIHGGPHLMWGPGVRSMWHEWQVAAARGYVVFFCNPRGSDGYGNAWRLATQSNWGFADAPDIHAGIDALLARGYIDPRRIAVTGGSYGGYMTVWLIAHSDRFACAAAARGVYNLLTQHSTSDAHELVELTFEGFPWENHALLWRHSPLAYAHRITTPLLILHAERDYRVPISEAEQLFTFLRRRKQVVEFVRYPREGHELTRTGEPDHRADHMRRILEWFDRFCQMRTDNRTSSRGEKTDG